MVEEQRTMNEWLERPLPKREKKYRAVIKEKPSMQQEIWEWLE